MSKVKKQEPESHIVSKKRSPIVVLGMDIAAVIIIILAPFIGLLPGPGGIPMLILGFGLLASNHEWAQDIVTYIKNHSDSLREIAFPDNPNIKMAWDIIAVCLLAVGLYFNLNATGLLKALSYGIMAGSTTTFMMNRNRIGWLDSRIRGESTSTKNK